MRLKYTYLLLLVLLFYKGFTVVQQQKSHLFPGGAPAQINNYHQSPGYFCNLNNVALLHDDCMCNEFEDENEETSTRKKTLSAHYNAALQNNCPGICLAGLYKAAFPYSNPPIYLTSEKYIFQRVLRI